MIRPHAGTVVPRAGAGHHPVILSFAGIPTGPSTVATVLTAVFGSLLMGVYANRLTAGLVLYPLLKGAAGRGREVKPGAVVLGLLCAAYYVFGLPH